MSDVGMTRHHYFDFFSQNSSEDSVSYTDLLWNDLS